ncbi:hypothetical protein [Paraburkholderia sp. GAS334]|jgi:surface antigen|uniref:hypothetical protein n=1 Tax=Paraburkholderia sp. GAS334 TaxID=3035131 RepID=UPI003D1F99C7
MRNIIGLGAVLGTCIACTTPVASQSMAEDPLNDPALTCRTVVGEAEIDGAMQQIMGRACRQPDGTWQIVQGTDSSETAIYPVPAYPYYPYYPYYDPWYWGPPVTIGVGASFIFVDHFHHFHHMDHVHFSHPSNGMGMRGGFRGTGGGSHGMGGMRQFGGMSGGGRRH